MDVIDTLSGIAAGSRLDELRAHRPAAREQAQATYDALFSPIDASAMSLLERYAVAAFVAALFDVSAAEQHYARLLADADPAIGAVITEAVELGRGAGPYGSFRGELAAESQAGPELILPPRLADALPALPTRWGYGWLPPCCTPTSSRSTRVTRPEIAFNRSSTPAGLPTASSPCPSS